MVATFRKSFDYKTYLAPGQQFESLEGAGVTSGRSLTIARLVTDQLGLLHVTLRDERGREISAFAEQVEAAIAEGHLVPAGVLVGSA